LKRLTGSNWLWLGAIAWVLLIIVTWHSEDLAATPVVAQGSGASDNGYQIEPGWYMRLGELYWDEATGHLLLCSEWSTDCPPGAPVTPEPSELPVIIPSITYTPDLTATPPPTNTPRPSPTPTLTPSATPGMPTPTPEMKCWGTVTATRLNVRDKPNGTVLGQVAQGDTLALEGVRYGEDGSKWYLIYWLPDVTGFVAVQYVEVDQDAACGHLIDRPMLGWTVVPGASRDALLLAGDLMMAGGITPSATITSDGETASVLHDAGWFVVVRMWAIWPGDCPDMSLPPATSARLRVEYLERQHGGARFSAAQLTNECAWPSAAYLRDWLIAAVGECDDRGWSCIPVTFNTGAPELTWLATLRPALRLMRERGHYLGYNAYPYDADRSLCEVNDWTSYTTYRWRKFAEEIPVDELPLLYLTEAARGDGAQPVVIEDTTCFVAATRGEVVAVNFWYDGVALAPWTGAAWSNGAKWEAARQWARALI